MATYPLAAETPKPGDAVRCPILQAGFGKKLFNRLACTERNRCLQSRYIIQLGPEFLGVAKDPAHGFAQPAMVLSQDKGSASRVKAFSIALDDHTARVFRSDFQVVFANRQMCAGCQTNQIDSVR